MSKLITLAYDDMPVSFTGQGWFNATEVAKRFGKLATEWLRLPETVRYIAALESRYGKIPHVKTSRARSDRGGGTWMHPRLGVAFARWLDVDFAIWCDEQIDLILRGGLADWRRSTPKDRASMLIKAIEASVIRHVSWSHVMGWGNRWAGVRKSRLMTVSQVSDTCGFIDRVRAYQETLDDARRIKAHSIEMYGESRQMPLLGMEVAS
jgi:hypothetical protein